MHTIDPVALQLLIDLLTQAVASTEKGLPYAGAANVRNVLTTLQNVKAARTAQ